MHGPAILGFSAKMYFGHWQTLEWAREAGQVADWHSAIREGRAELFMLPSTPFLAEVASVLAGHPVAVGAQDASAHVDGSHTGEASAVQLGEAGAQLIAVGHAERRRAGDAPEIVAAKVARVTEAGLTTLLCIGEEKRTTPEQAARTCVDQVTSAVCDLTEAPTLLLGYEPVWAIGADAPAPAGYVAEVVTLLRDGAARVGVDARILYGGSARPGTHAELAGSVDGLFLGRFAHDPAVLPALLDEIAAVR